MSRPPRRFEIERDQLLAAVDRGEIGRFAVVERAVMARVVALPGRLDLDHPRAELGQQQSAVGARQDAGEVDDRDAGKRPRLRHGSGPLDAEVVNSVARAWSQPGASAESASRGRGRPSTAAATSPVAAA